MAIVCDKCMKEYVTSNGDICDNCLRLAALANIDTSFTNKLYLPKDLYDKFLKLSQDVSDDRAGAKKAIGKFLRNLKTSFLTTCGKEINDPTPSVIIPKDRTIDRIQKILEHNIAAYARQNDMDTPEDLDDWSVADMYSDDWEQSLYQYVDNITVMEDDSPTADSSLASESDSAADSAPAAD